MAPLIADQLDMFDQDASEETCRCLVRGASHGGGGFTRRKHDGMWVHRICMRPTPPFLEGVRAGRIKL